MRMLGNTNLIKVFSIAILAACSIQAGIPLDPDNLDQAWLAALALAHEAGMNHGRDIVFTYGPLGYTHPYQAYLPSTFSSYITGHLLVTAIQCIVIACAAASAHVGVFLSAVFAVAVAQSLVKTDLLFYLALYSSAVLLIRGLDASLTRWNLLTLILIGLNLAIASLYKFTGLAISLLIFPLCFASFGRLIPPRGLKVSVATYIFAFISIWSGLGGKIATIPAYISNSMEISSNYDAAMALAGRTRDTVLGVAALLVYAVILALSSYRSRWAASRTIPLATLLFGIAFIVWKAAYVRQDDGHLLLFPMFIGWAGCFAHLGFSSVRHLGFYKGSTLRSTRLQIAFAITSISWWLVIYLGLIDSSARFVTALFADHKQNAGLLLGGAHVPKQVAELSAILEANKLKRIHSMVDGGSIDGFGGGQGIVALHGWSYRPRPILQEHMAYTPKLTAINGDFLRTKNAAKWILYRANAIDNRYPGAEDPLALQALLECYSPAEAERGYVLLRRKECSRIHGEVALDRLERTVSIGEKAPVKRCREPCIRKVYVHLDRGIFSRIAAILLREPEYAVVLGVGEERQIEFRMPPRAWETGIIIDPLLFDTNAIVAWYSTRSPNVLVDSVEIKVRTNRPQWLLPARARVAVVSFPM